LNFRDNTEKLTSARYDKNQFLLAVYIDNEVVKLNLIKEGEELKKELKILRKSVKTNDLALLEKSTEYVSSCLIYPFSSELETKSKLRIVVGEKLTQLPVEVLYLNREKTRQLVEMNTSYHFSLFDIGNKQIVDYRNSRILALAPQFDGDKGLLSQRSYWCDTDSATYRESIFRSPGILSMLPNAQDEVKEINLRYQTKVEKLTVFTNEVTKACFMSSLKNYDIVHIATHGYVDKKDYRNSGLFFSQNNGDDFLHLNEIYNLEIDANLIVLSACKTNVGQSQTGEGLMALPRGFIYAGVPNVIASLWKVHDERTKDLMLAFYKYLLEDKQTYAGALRKAKLDCIEKGFLPMDWAGFVLIGQ